MNNENAVEFRHIRMDYGERTVIRDLTLSIAKGEAGTVIKAREVKTVDGYLLDGTPQDIEITKAAVNELTFWNVLAQSGNDSRKSG